MRHRKSGKRLGRNTSHRKAMMRNMVTSLFDHEKITTTDARAKELRKVAEKLITMAKRGDLHSRRMALEVVRDKQVVAKLFETIAPRYQKRPGGYTRIIKLGHRAGDNAALSIIELVEEEFTPKPKKKAPKQKAETPKPKATTEEVSASDSKQALEDQVQEQTEESPEQISTDDTASPVSNEPSESAQDSSMEKSEGDSEEQVETTGESVEEKKD
ncbi:MAG: 50S ribosomal protein L17 [Deltaproteobacteria bacterium]|jgi:large subunit ribosomal protein L17|nr:50S ribosomal protein L17 [Deltaproteobacteria bacterium]MBW2477035.1 50S ribosomal protein L17 [Deltaproteobacteria bacterium]MBW2503360.1 50S ribosomal protein L17 [Deltaproteobacteria bacterium]MBW2520590.1 50S ribosomal protein L17 [Deltaproteobacteria bacterium]